MIMASLEELPAELQQHIVEFCDRDTQKSYSLVSRRAWDAATTAIWRDVKLIDTRSTHLVPEEQRVYWSEDTWLGRDEHDDTPIIRKLLVLAQNKRIAAKVKILTHRCHLPLPAIFSELPQVCFANVKLSNDPRTLQLLYYAAHNMENVQTLRLIHGHHNLVQGLLWSFFKPDRAKTPRHLWLESCSVNSFHDLLNTANSRLESIRLRRLQRVDLGDQFGEGYRYSRGGDIAALHNGVGSVYETTVDQQTTLLEYRSSSICEFPEVTWLNEQTYAGISEATIFLADQRERATIPLETLPIKQPYSLSSGFLVDYATSSLRSLTLDWLLTCNRAGFQDEQYKSFKALSLLKFPKLRAFQLRNAITTDTTLSDRIYLLHPEADVLDSPESGESDLDMLTFMENHPNLECLAWPIDRFYSHKRTAGKELTGFRGRAAAVVSNLGRTLTSLRVDSYYTTRGETQTDEGGDVDAHAERIRRRLFITDFAAYMTKITQIKIEGGVPRDEKREIMRALHHCPLEKVVAIGVSFPLGNAWGPNGEELAALDEGHLFHSLLEPEHEEALAECTKAPLEELPTGYKYRAEWGWPPGPPLLHTIALHHASTITEMKFCGYNGSPVLHQPTAITKMLLHHLRFFHNLSRLTASFWIVTFFDFDWREPEIIAYWMDKEDLNSTALVPVDLPVDLPEPVDAVSSAATDGAEDMSMTDTNDMNGVSYTSSTTSSAAAVGNHLIQLNSPLPGEGGLAPVDPSILAMPAAPTAPQPEITRENPWAVELRNKYSPTALAKGMYDIVGTHLSPQARARQHKRGRGVNVRASFCLGVETGDIFDFDMMIDDKGVVPGDWIGPRDEGEKGRWWAKLENRQWFG